MVSISRHIYKDKKQIMSDVYTNNFLFSVFHLFLSLSLSFSLTVQYSGLYTYVSNQNNTGYASADLNLLSVEYNLFNFLPFNFCGDWVSSGRYNDGACPSDGQYTFSVPYTLPWDDGDITTWFATGWQGNSNLIIYSSPAEDNSTLLASCTLHWKTYVTKNETADEGWKTLPSAAQVAIIMASVLACMCCCCFYLSCCRRRRRKKHVTDIDYEGTDLGRFKIFDDKKIKEEQKKKEKDELLYKINVNMKDEPDWA